MTIDERIEKLAERHEALAQSVESLSLNVRQQSQNIDKLSLDVQQQTQNVDKLVGVMADLIQVARLHERRISDLESGR